MKNKKRIGVDDDGRVLFKCKTTITVPENCTIASIVRFFERQGRAFGKDALVRPYYNNHAEFEITFNEKETDEEYQKRIDKNAKHKLSKQKKELNLYKKLNQKYGK